jgi:PAS domain S-box-containing protein
MLDPMFRPPPRDSTAILKRQPRKVSFQSKTATTESTTLTTTQAAFCQPQKRSRETLAARDISEAVLDVTRPFLVLGADLRIKMANGSFCRQFRFAEKELQNRLVSDLGPGWNCPLLQVLLGEVIPRNSFFDDFEERHEFPGLGPRTVLFSARRVKGFPLIVINVDDVTERLHFQAAMRRSESHYRSLFETARDGILIVDAETRAITECNPALKDLIGYTAEETVGKKLWEVGITPNSAAIDVLLKTARTEGFIRDAYMIVNTKSGSSREVEFVGGLFQEDGREMMKCNLRDNSARQRTERLMASCNERVKRHAALLEERVVEKSTHLRAMVEELEMFGYSVAHDMRAPLRAMASFSHLLSDDFGAHLPVEARAITDYITAAATRMDTLIQDVLTYSKIPNGTMELSPLDLDLLVRQVIQAYPELHAPGVRIEFASVLPTILGHPAAVSQCIFNLLSNAVKFVAPGTAPHVRLSAVVSPGRMALWVEDNGIGIDPNHLDRIFKMFERVSTDYEGTGIGLAIVRKSIERLGGTVGVQSTLGQGSRFFLEFKMPESSAKV